MDTSIAGLPPKGNARLQPGVGQNKETTGQSSHNDRTRVKAAASEGIKPDLLAAHFCCCKPGVPCIFCLRWSRRIRAHEQRRADSLQRQALGQRARAGG